MKRTADDERLFVLAPGTRVAAVGSLSSADQCTLPFAPNQWVVVRKGARTMPKPIDRHWAPLIEAFRRPMPISAAIRRYCAINKYSPAAVFDDVFSFLSQLTSAGWLVECNDAMQFGSRALLEIGQQLQSWVILRSVQLTDDSEVYLARRGREYAAVKLGRQPDKSRIALQLAKEAQTVAQLDGRVNPQLLDSGSWHGRAFLILRWAMGRNAAVAAKQLRQCDDRDELLRMSVSILQAYAVVHAQLLIHGDPHPRNTLIDNDGNVTIIDYGLAIASECHADQVSRQRPCAGVFAAPEDVFAAVDDNAQTADFPASEQYGLAAMLYHLFTGRHYLRFDIDPQRRLQQIVESPALGFTECGQPPWPAVESVVCKALAKLPDERYSSIAEFAAALESTNVQRKRSARAPRNLENVAHRFVEECVGAFHRVKELPPPNCSLAYGAAGIAYAFYRIGRLRGDSELFNRAAAWSAYAVEAIRNPTSFWESTLGLTSQTVNRQSVFFADAGVRIVSALIHSARGESAQFRAAETSLVDCFAGHVDAVDFTNGAAGALHGCTVLCQGSRRHPRAHDLGHKLFATLCTWLERQTPLYGSTELQYLGMAHGWAGILLAILRWSERYEEDIPTAVVDRLEELSQLAVPVGGAMRWPRQVGGTIGDSMSGWCNGSAGFVQVFVAAYDVLKDGHYLELAQRAAWDVAQDSEMSTNLCCGLSGRVFALLRLFQRTDDKRLIDAIWELLGRAISAKPSGHANASLYKGRLGIAVTAAEVLSPEDTTQSILGS